MGSSELRGNRCAGCLVAMYGGQKTWATFYFFIPALTIHLQGTWRKPSFSRTPQGKHLSFPVHFLLPASVTQDFPSVTQRRLGRFQQTVSLAAGSGDMQASHAPRPSGYSQPCAGAAFLSAHSLHCPGHAGSPGERLRSPPGVAPWVSAHVFGVLRDSDQVAEHQLRGAGEAAA